MSLIERVHAAYVQKRRVDVLSEELAHQLPHGARVLDVGSGDGWVAHLVQQRRPDLRLHGVDVLVRHNTFVPVSAFDGLHLPEPDGSYDAVLFVDVLHHTENPVILLKEAVRVATKAIVIKDHTANGIHASRILKFMDRVGNRRYGVALPYNYWPEERWRRTFAELGLEAKSWLTRLGLYPWPASLIFERNLHFIARLEPVAA